MGTLKVLRKFAWHLPSVCSGSARALICVDPLMCDAEVTNVACSLKGGVSEVLWWPDRACAKPEYQALWLFTSDVASSLVAL